MYADTETNSMRIAISETSRRRTMQAAYNEAHGITPKSIVRKVTDVMEGARNEGEGERGRSGRGSQRKVAEAAPDYRLLTPEQIAAKIRQLEARMYKHAQDLEFEDAARLRDEIHQIREQGLIG
jgi:excinuclease ABC subunit B